MARNPEERRPDDVPPPEHGAVVRPGGARPADSAPADAKGPAERDAVVEAPMPFTQVVGRVTLAGLAVLFVVFAFFNLHYVDFHYVFDRTDVVSQAGERISGGVPLIALLLGSFGLGLVVGAGFVSRSQRLKRARRARTEASPTTS